MTGIAGATTEAVPAKNTKSTGIAVPDSLRRPIFTKPKVLMGSGPTNYTQRVIEAMTKPITGLYSNEYFRIMEEIKDGVRYLVQTNNPVTCCVTGTGNAGLETVFSNLIEKGDKVLVVITGDTGRRAVELAQRYGAKVETLEAKPGANLKFEQISAHVEAHKPKLLFVVHGETSTGVLQPLNDIGDVCHRNNCLFVVDACSTFGAVEILADKWQIDALYAASHKAIGAPAGLSPVTLSQRAMTAVNARKTTPPVYFFDIKLIASKWGCFEGKRL